MSDEWTTSDVPDGIRWPSRERHSYFIGGSLDGKTLKTMGATFYIHVLGDGRHEEYQRTRVVYSDGANYANEVNQEKLSHLEYTFLREAGKEIL